MANLENQTVNKNKDDETVSSTQEKPQGRHIITGRPDLNEIKKKMQKKKNKIGNQYTP